jgi:MFS transporter, OPA family, glycerol-3-phosphate transporter
MLNIFAPAPHKPQLSEAEVRRRYPIFRWRVLEATFIGYATYYLVRNNLSVVSKDLIDELHYSKAQIGNLTAVTALTYGFGKFLMGAWSDRSNPRMFMAAGLLITAFLNFLFGSFHDYQTHFALWALNGFFQGMGWPPCGRSMGHWYSERERGLTFSIWNTSHNVGGGIAGYIAGWAVGHYGGWQYAFFIPGILAAVGAIYLFFRLVDTPQSEGLPPIEIYKQDMTPQQRESGLQERELTWGELFWDNVFFNKWVWILAFGNFFAYISRYSMLDWGPLYLRQMKGAKVEDGGFAILIQEFGGIPSTILLGWMSDKIGGRRGMICALCMLPIIAAFAGIRIVPENHAWMDYWLLAIISLFIYPVINLVVIMALDITSKKAIGVAAGFIGLFGYLGRFVQAKVIGPILDHYDKLKQPQLGWDMTFLLIIACTIAGFGLLALTWRIKPRA